MGVPARLVTGTRLGIPAIVHEECLTGLSAWKAATFPTPLAWGATFDPDLVARMGARDRRGRCGRSASTRAWPRCSTSYATPAGAASRSASPRTRTWSSYQSSQGAFPTWLTSVTRNLLVDHYRRTRRDRMTDSIDDAMPQLEERRSAAHSPDKLAQASQLSAQLQRGLARLSPELREAVILRDLQGLDYGEIRTVLQVPEGTVKSRINRGRIELARILGEMGVRPA